MAATAQSPIPHPWEREVRHGGALPTIGQYGPTPKAA